MSQIQTKFIANEAVTTPKVGSLSATSAQTLFADGSGGAAFRNIIATDLPGTITSNTTGTASNITATTNTTLTTLSSLSLPTSQLSGNVNLTTQVSGALPVANGGTGDTSFSINQVILGGTTSTGPLAQVPGGASGTVLTSNGTTAAPTWQAASVGTVTSVALADGSTTPIYTITNSPVTSAGTLTFSLNTQTANTVFAGPSTGSATQPTFRSLVIADLSFAGAASGVATLDGSGKVPLSQLPSTLMEFKGNWNPNTNTPVLVDGTGTTGFTYWVSALDTGTVAGLTDPSMVNFQVGDLVIYNGTKWVLTTPAFSGGNNFNYFSIMKTG
jgi:hypothetical protein